ncbi:hypothetical protein E2C01_048669 [Portunus trituberculatus]|uniref:Uncharacterized protein n=1 Tax=Portunus trituberculatus TaxID=210409 RepID=A0A5B7GE19_PORTR|nr:hypothetical protein [Portunus trituberculatus]
MSAGEEEEEEEEEEEKEEEYKGIQRKTKERTDSNIPIGPTEAVCVPIFHYRFFELETEGH